MTANLGDREREAGDEDVVASFGADIVPDAPETETTEGSCHR
jgi:hypothetical protein